MEPVFILWLDFVLLPLTEFASSSAFTSQHACLWAVMFVLGSMERSCRAGWREPAS